MSDVEHVIYWKGRLLSDLSKDELVEVVQFLANENAVLRKDRDKWRRSGDVLQYLRDGAR